MEKISVLMTVYNEDVTMIRKAIFSILSQTYKDIEVIVMVDDPNNDDAISFLKEMNDRRVSVYINKENIGLPESLNVALRYASGKYIARMDADDVSDIKRLDRQYKYLKSGDYDLVGCFIKFIRNGRIVKKMEYPKGIKAIKEYMKYASPISHATWLARREVFDIVGGYRNIFAVEDLDFLIRASFKNIRMSNYDEALYSVEMTNESISRSNSGLQEVTARYLRKKYKDGISPSMNELTKYQSTNHFKRLVKRCNKYYDVKIKRSYLKRKKLICFIFYTIKLFLYPDILLKDLNEKIHCRVIKLREKA